jgi:hypothetical protein
LEQEYAVPLCHAELSDYIPTSRQLTFNATSTTECVKIGIVDDFDLEDTESFNVTLSTSDDDVTITTPMAAVTILDNDAVNISLEQTEYLVSEDDGTVEICVLTSRLVQRELVVTVTTQDRTAGRNYHTV